MNLSNFLVKDRMISVGIHTLILTLLLLIALFINSVVLGPIFLPDNFFKSHFILSITLNFCFFYLIYFYIKSLENKLNVFPKVIGLLLILITAIISSVWLDLFLAETPFNLNNKLTRYFFCSKYLLKKLLYEQCFTDFCDY